MNAVPGRTPRASSWIDWRGCCGHLSGRIAAPPCARSRTEIGLEFPQDYQRFVDRYGGGYLLNSRALRFSITARHSGVLRRGGSTGSAGSSTSTSVTSGHCSCSRERANPSGAEPPIRSTQTKAACWPSTAGQVPGLPGHPKPRENQHPQTPVRTCPAAASTSNPRHPSRDLRQVRAAPSPILRTPPATRARPAPPAHGPAPRRSATATA